MDIKSNLEIKRTFSVDGVEYATKEEAKSALAMSILNTHIPNGVDAVISNADDIVKALRIVTNTRG
jgi:hypothetical protein